jgi:hypothetical protein
MKFWSRIKTWFTGAPNQLSIPSSEILMVPTASSTAQKPPAPLRALPSVKQQKPLKPVEAKPSVVPHREPEEPASVALPIEPEPTTPAVTASSNSKPVALVATVTKRAELAMSMKSRPPQLNLFRLVQEGFTNAFDFYEAIPRFVVAR